VELEESQCELDLKTFTSDGTFVTGNIILLYVLANSVGQSTVTFTSFS
jgi:hypothetical protein